LAQTQRKHRDWHQFRFDVRGNRWYAIHNEDAVNESLLNGRAVHKPTPVTAGDVRAVGSGSKGIAKLPLRVRFD
jgi:hypothetical protein